MEGIGVMLKIELNYGLARCVECTIMRDSIKLMRLKVACLNFSISQ